MDQLERKLRRDLAFAVWGNRMLSGIGVLVALLCLFILIKKALGYGT